MKLNKRMLRADELIKLQGFPDEYRLLTDKYLAERAEHIAGINKTEGLLINLRNYMSDTYTPPKKIKFKSDESEAEYRTIVRPQGKKDSVHYLYTYTKSQTKLDDNIGFTEKQLNDLLTAEIISVIQ